MYPEIFNKSNTKPYFRVRYEHFIDDLLSLNLEEIVDIIRSSFTKVSDTRYLDMGFSMDSNEESKIINILRDDYGLDAIPYPVTVPIPEDCPTNVNSFILDFLLPADVVAGVKNGKPVIQSKVMFAGEYFGYWGTTDNDSLNKVKKQINKYYHLYGFMYQRLYVNTFEVMDKDSCCLDVCLWDEEKKEHGNKWWKFIDRLFFSISCCYIKNFIISPFLKTSIFCFLISDSTIIFCSCLNDRID